MPSSYTVEIYDFFETIEELEKTTPGIKSRFEEYLRRNPFFRGNDTIIRWGICPDDISFWEGDAKAIQHLEDMEKLCQLLGLKREEEPDVYFEISW